MAGKKGLIMGVANERSIAWAIAGKTTAEHGAQLAFTYQGDVQEKRVRPLAERAGSNEFCLATFPTGPLTPYSTNFDPAGTELDFVVHAIAHADKEELKGRYLETSRDNFLTRWIWPVIPLPRFAGRRATLMNNGGSLLTLSYLGAERVMPHYNVMGVAKAALEASVRYLAEDLGPKQYPGKFPVRGTDEDPGGLGHRRFSLYFEMERV